MAAGVDRLFDELVSAALRVLVTLQDVFDFVILKHARQAVGAKHQAVAIAHHELVQIGLGARVAAKRSSDDRALRVGFGLFCRDLALFDEVGYEAVVACDLLKPAVVEQVGARVANLCDYQVVFLQDGGGAGGSHARAAKASASCANDGDVRLFDSLTQRVGVGVLRCAFGDGVDGDFGSNLTSCVSAHAVAYHVQRWGDGEGVFVVLAHAAHIGAAAEGCACFAVIAHSAH